MNIDDLEAILYRYVSKPHEEKQDLGLDSLHRYRWSAPVLPVQAVRPEILSSHNVSNKMLWIYRYVF
jgi:hypothetical protein